MQLSLDKAELQTQGCKIEILDHNALSIESPYRNMQSNSVNFIIFIKRL
jgi:hypothetical protein